MYIVVISYIIPLERVDKLVPFHASWLKERTERTDFIAVGRQIPRVGGIYITRSFPRNILEQVLSSDPLLINNAATHKIIEFNPALVAPGFDLFMEL